MKKKIIKIAKKKLTITTDKLRSLYYIHYGHRVINFSNEFLDFIRALGFIIKE